MREIKFRGFDPINSKVIEWEGMQAWTMRSFGSPNIMQYTGLKDKNGKEIYEGDVLSGGFLVEYRNDCFVVEEHKNDWSSVHFVLHHNPDLEVIGNVYENPELIK